MLAKRRWTISAGALALMAVALGCDDGARRPADARSRGDAGVGGNAPARVPTARAVATNFAHTCAIRMDGTVACWGINSESTPPAGTFSNLALGSGFSCGITTPAQNVICWGNWGRPVPSGRFTQISVAGLTAGNALASETRTACGVMTDGALVCWGDANWGRDPAPPAGTFKQVSVSGWIPFTFNAYACAITTDGAAKCWGDNSFGQATPPPGSYTQISAGPDHACALRTDRSIACWGSNDHGQTRAPAGSFTAVGAGGTYEDRGRGRGHSCAVGTNGTVTCWGDNDFGQSTPPGAFAQISVGDTSVCGLRVDGTVACWGADSYGESTPPVGAVRHVAAGDGMLCTVDGDGRTGCWPADSSPAGPVAAIAAGYNRACAIRTDGSLYCWGHDAQAVTGVQDTPPPAGAFSRVSLGFFNSCALRADGAAVCWGVGRLLTLPPGSYTEISIGSGPGNEHACAVRADGALACWGSSGLDESRPPPGGAFVQVGVGLYGSCGITAGGALSCWGQNAETPPAGTFTRLSLGMYGCAVRTDGNLACWGKEKPQDPVPAGRFSEVSVSEGYACAIEGETGKPGRLWCWGKLARQPL
jgi:alpha-tubulin suppressor-like RCC1 family protein